jgi:hypothetical protein
MQPSEYRNAMIRVITEIPAAELPEALAHLLPAGAMSAGARFRVTVEVIGSGSAEEDADSSPEFAAICHGLADAEADRLVDEETLYLRLFGKYAPPSA